MFLHPSLLVFSFSLVREPVEVRCKVIEKAEEIVCIFPVLSSLGYELQSSLLMLKVEVGNQNYSNQ